MTLDIDTLSFSQEVIKSHPNDFFIRVKTCYYSSNKGIHSRKDITILKRKSNPMQVDCFFEDVNMFGVEYKFPFKEFFDLEDGEYRVKIRTFGRSSYYDDDFDYEYVIEKV